VLSAFLGARFNYPRGQIPAQENHSYRQAFEGSAQTAPRFFRRWASNMRTALKVLDGDQHGRVNGLQALADKLPKG